MLSAQNIRREALRRCDFLAIQMGSNTALVEKLMTHGLSESWIRKFIGHHTTNPTIDKLDKLLVALDSVESGD